MAIPSTSTIVILAIIFGLGLALLRRPWTALAITLYAICFAILGSLIKEAYLGIALTLADMHFFLLRPLENFKLFLNYPLLGMTLLGVILGAVLCIAVGLRFERPLKVMQRPKVGILIRAGTLAATILLAFGSSLLTARDSHAQVNDGDAYAAFIAMYEMQHVHSLVQRINVFFNNRSVEATLPAPRQQSRFVSMPVDNSPSTEIETSVRTRPDIFLILEESTFDTTLLRGCRPEDCDNEMLHPLPQAVRTQQGPLLVHTTGGGTWLAEFAIMSGLDWRVFGRGGAFAPVSLAPRLRASLPLHLRELGYRTIAIYPTDGNFLSARSAYDYYGFEEFYDARDLKLPDEWGDIRDSMVFDKALAAAGGKLDTRPVFVFVLTIRNHGPHGEKPRKIPALFNRAQHDTSVGMADYLARTRDSSNDLLRLAGQWLKSSRPRVLAWFGDHQPEAAWDFTEHPELLHAERVASNVSGEQLKYITHYQLSSNFGEARKVSNHQALDISYLGAELLAFAGQPVGPAEVAAQKIAVECHGLMFECADRELVKDYLAYRIYDLKALQ